MGNRTILFLLIAYAHMPLTIAHADVSSGARVLKIDLSLYLHPYYMYASGADTGCTYSPVPSLLVDAITQKSPVCAHHAYIVDFFNSFIYIFGASNHWKHLYETHSMNTHNI